MFTKKNRKLLIALTIILVLALAGTILSGFTLKTTNDQWYSQTHNLIRPASLTDEYVMATDKTVGGFSEYWQPLDSDKMLEQSAVVVTGRVLGFDYLNILPVYGQAPDVFTDYYIQISAVLRGEPYNKEQIIIRAQGGENETMIMVNDGLSLEVGKDYLFFLDKPVCGGGHNTKGNYYYITGGSSGVYEAGSSTAKNADGAIVFESYQPLGSSEKSANALEYKSFAKMVEKYNKTNPVDENYQLKRYERDISSNLKSGFITQAEYDRSKEQLEHYATIIGKVK